MKLGESLFVYVETLVRTGIIRTVKIIILNSVTFIWLNLPLWTKFLYMVPQEYRW